MQRLFGKISMRGLWRILAAFVAFISMAFGLLVACLAFRALQAHKIEGASLICIAIWATISALAFAAIYRCDGRLRRIHRLCTEAC